MKSTKDFRPANDHDGDSIKKATKLEPIKKSGREKSSFYKSVDDEDEDDLDYKKLQKRESILDYFGDDEDEPEEDEEFDDEEYDDEDDIDEEEEYDEDDDIEEEEK